MKKTILNVMAALFLWTGAVHAQQMIVDLSTGDPLYNIQTGGLDPIWQVKKPGTNVYVSPYITTGRDGNYNLDYQTIHPMPRVIAPNMWWTAAGGANQFDIKTASPFGEYQYRLQFNFN